MAATVDRTIVVLGATGILGGAVARHFAKLAGFHVRAVTRDPSSKASIALQTVIPGIEIVKGDLNEEESLYRSFRQAHAIFALTHYWRLLATTAVKEEADREGISPNRVAMQHEYRQCCNLFNALARVVLEQEAAGNTVLEHVVLSTLPDVPVVSGGKYTRAYHFESKAKSVAALDQGAAALLPGYQQVLDRASYIYIGAYLDSFFSKSYLSVDGHHLIGPSKMEDGSFLFRHVACPPYRPIPFLCPEKDLGALVEALVLHAPAGTRLLGGKVMTLQDFAVCWGRSLQVPVRWEAIGIEEMVCEFPETSQEFVRTASEAAAFVTEFGFDGGLGAMLPSKVGVQTDKLVDIEQWVREQDWSAWL